MISKLLVVAHTLNFLIGALCASILGLTSHSIVIKDGLDLYVPPNTRSIGVSVLMWAGVGGIVDMLLLGAGLIIGSLKSSKYGRKHEINTRRLQYPNSILFVATFVLLRPLIVLIYTFVEHNRSVENWKPLRNGYVTPESWACDAHLGEDARHLCRDLRAARYILIPIVMLAAALLGIVVLMYLTTQRSRKVASREAAGSLRAVGDLR